MGHIIEVEQVSKRYGDNLALDRVSLTVGAGELVGFLGPNGSGKSSLISILNGLRRPSQGTVRIAGGNPRDRAVRTVLGSTPQETGVPNYLKVSEAIHILGLHYPARLSADETIQRFHLEDIAAKRVGSLSGGQRRKVAVALAFVGKPRVVLLDEPSTGLDITAREDIWRCVLEQRELGVTILVTSHYLEEIEALADRVILIEKGEIIADQPLAEMLNRTTQTVIEVHSDDLRILELPYIVSHHRSGQRLRISVDDTNGFVAALAQSGYSYSTLNIQKASLGDLFQELTDEVKS